MDSNKPYSLIDNMLELVRASILNRDPISFQNAGVDWDELLDKSAEHGLVTWVWDGIQKLPADCQPSRIQRINFSLSSKEVEDCYLHQKQVLIKMVEVCNQNKIRLLLLKGIGLSELYPIPEFRSSSDLDIFLFGHYELGNQLFAQSDIKIGPKDSVFKYCGVTIENHYNFLNPDWPVKRQINSYIKSNIEKAELTKDGYYILEPMSNLLYLVMHATKHLRYNDAIISIRNIIDIPLFIKHNSSFLTPERCYNTFDLFHISHCFELFVILGEIALGTDMSEYRKGLVPQEDIESAYKMIFKRDIVKGIPENISYLQYLKLDRKKRIQDRWKYNYITISKGDRVKESIREHFHVLIKYILGKPLDKPLLFTKK